MAAEHEGDRERGPGIERRRRAGEHEDAGADDGADAHGGDAERAQHLAQGFEGAAFVAMMSAIGLRAKTPCVIHPPPPLAIFPDCQPCHRDCGDMRPMPVGLHVICHATPWCSITFTSAFGNPSQGGRP
jgi:hypothetical protein